MSRIATLCMNPSVDHSGKTERLEPGHKSRCSDERREPGGGGINVARGITKLGGSVVAIYPAGGPGGRRLESLLEEEGVEQRVIPIEHDTRENVAIQESSSGHNYHFVFPGAQLSGEERAECEAAVLDLDPAPAYLVMSGSLPPEMDAGFYADLAERCAERGIRGIVDTSGDALRAALEGECYLIKPNRRELAEIYDLAGQTPEDLYPCLQRVVDEGHAQAMVVTLGPDGALLVTAEQRLHVKPPHIEGESPVGAGDSFVAAMVHRLAEDAPLDEALKHGVAAAAAAVKTPGTELYHRDELERMVSELEISDERRGG